MNNIATMAFSRAQKPGLLQAGSRPSTAKPPEVRFGQSENPETVTPRQVAQFAENPDPSVQQAALTLFFSLKDLAQQVQVLELLPEEKAPAFARKALERYRDHGAALYLAMAQNPALNAKNVPQRLAEKGLSTYTCKLLAETNDRNLVALALQGLKRQIGTQGLLEICQSIPRAQGNAREGLVNLVTRAFQQFSDTDKPNLLIRLYEDGQFETAVLLMDSLKDDPGKVRAAFLQRIQATHRQEINRLTNEYENRISRREEDIRYNYTRKSDYDIWRDSDPTR